MSWFALAQLLMTSLALVLMTSLALVLGKEEVATDLDLLVGKPTRCTYSRAYGMYGAFCAELKLTALPHHLKTSIEILEMSDNKIRELQADTFTKFPNIRFLYMAENAIYIIDKDAFNPLTSLETLDLSRNAITFIPHTIFSIATLRRLDLRGNALVHLDEDLKDLPRPIKAPLERLDLSDCRITKLPNLGIMPELQIYNVSLNNLLVLDPLTFAGTCKLGTVDLTKSLNIIRLCDMRSAVNWFTLKGISFRLEDYSRLNSEDFHQCPVEPYSEAVNETYQRCLAENVNIRVRRTSQRTWLTVTGGLAGFLVAFMLLLYAMHRKNVAQTKKPVASVHKPKHDGDKKASATLLSLGPR